MKWLFTSWFLFCSLLVSSLQAQEGIFAEFQTDKGKLVYELDYVHRPLTVCYFAALAKGLIKTPMNPKGEPLYNKTIFYRNYKDEYLMGGDPNGDGTGNPNLFIHEEIDTFLTHEPHRICLSNQMLNTTGHIFYLTKKPCHRLDEKFTVFGKLVEGLEILYQLKVGDTIQSVKIIQKGKAAKAFKINEENVKELLAARVKNWFDSRNRDIAFFHEWVLKQYPNAKKTISGLMYLPLEEGSGDNIKEGDVVTFSYIAKFMDGTVFDQMIGDNKSSTTTIGKSTVVRGWEEGLKLMKPGAKYLLFIPYTLGYGETSFKDVIPPKCNLIIETNLISVKK